MFLLNVATFIAVVWYACTTRNMWKEMRTQTETGQKQLEQSERAWLILDITADSGFEFTKEGEARITFIPHINNIGKSVATGVTFNAKLFLQDPVNGDRFFREPLQHQKELCDTIAKTPLATGNDTSMALTIFPTDTNQELGHGFSIWKGKNLTIP